MPKRKNTKSNSSSKVGSAAAEGPSVTARLESLRKKRMDGESKLDELEGAVASMIEDLTGRLGALQAEFESLRKDVALLGKRFKKLEADALSETRYDEMQQSIESRLNELAAAISDLRSFSVLSPEEFSYFRFENLHRGSKDHVARSLTPYVDFFARCQRVVDLGCGRGEFLDLCRSQGIGIYGVDSNEDMVLHCEGLGLNAISADVVEHLKSLPEKWLDGVFCSQVVEHLPLSELLSLLKESLRVLKVGARLVIVTINPTSIFSLANNFYLDPTHVRPLPPGTLRFLAEEVGFRDMDVQYHAPFGGDYSLIPVEVEDETEWQRALRINFERLNHLVLGYQEYALIGLK
jgi:O-antigen chain-terminating methyltransferase